MRKKSWAIAVSLVLVLAMSAVGAVAYLTSRTDAVVNTFTVGKLLEDPQYFVLKEHEATDSDKDGVYTLDKDKEVKENTYVVLPGVDLPKDPFVKTTDELKLDAYVFIEVVDNTGSNIHFTVDSDNWTKLTGVTGPNSGEVYVIKANGGIVKADTTLGPVSILKQNENGKEITVDNVEITDAEAQFGGEVKFYGYMIQAAGFENCSAAWTAVSGTSAE